MNQSVYDIVTAIGKGETTARAVVAESLAAIAARDAQVRAFVCVDGEGALAAADEVDRRLAAGERVGPLAGVPVAIKDNICTLNLPTTCASRMLEDYTSPYEAGVVERLRSAGAIVVGKTNLDEFAMGSSNENSALFRTVNAWSPDRVAGGSSGGSAVAVAAGMVPCALGSDTGGSIRLPASFNGVVGLKPTYGRVSRYGLVAFGSSLDQIGPITRDARDAAIVLSVIAGDDARDSTNVRGRPFISGIADGETTPDPFSVGVASECFGEGLAGSVRASVEAGIGRLGELGAETVDIRLPHMEYAIACYYIIATAEASSNLARYDGVHYGHRTSRADDIFELYSHSRVEGFGAEVKRRIMLGTYVLSSGYYDAYYKKALQVRTLIRRDFEKAFEKVDVIASPVAPTTAFRVGEKTDDPLAMYLADVYTTSANLAGLPAISIPCGFDEDGMPIGLQLMGRWFEEDRLLAIAHRFLEGTDYNRLSPLCNPAR